MVRVGTRLTVRALRVAIDAGERGVVRRDEMAIGTHRAVVRNREVGMVKRRAEPGSGVVTRVAGGRVARGDVVGDGAAQRDRALPGREVATVTIRVRSREGVIVIDVALPASRAGQVIAGQRPARGAVIELCVGPQKRVVAGRAKRCWETGLDVIRHVSAKRRSALPGGDVAAVAVRIRRGKIVIVSYVAIGARDDSSCRRQLMRTRERPTGHAMVENSCIPGNRVVTGGAICRSEGRAGAWVRGIIGLLPGAQMASGIAAVGGRNIQAEVVVDVAGSAGRNFTAVCHQRVRVRQWKAKGIVVEFSVSPDRDGVACRASRRGGRESRLDVVRHGPAEGRRAVPCSEVATHAIGRVQRVVVADVAGRARRRRGRRMRAGQRKARDTVIERRGVPTPRRVASGAIRYRKCGSRRCVYGVICLLPRRQMASGIAAVGRRDLQVVVVADVAGNAGHVRVTVGQRKSCRVVIEFRTEPAIK